MLPIHTPEETDSYEDETEDDNDSLISLIGALMWVYTKSSVYSALNKLSIFNRSDTNKELDTVIVIENQTVDKPGN